MTEGAGPVELEAGELRSRSFVLTEKVARGTFGTVYKVADKQVPLALARSIRRRSIIRKIWSRRRRDAPLRFADRRDAGSETRQTGSAYKGTAWDGREGRFLFACGAATMEGWLWAVGEGRLWRLRRARACHHCARARAVL